MRLSGTSDEKVFDHHNP